MIEVTPNDRTREAATIEQLGVVLDQVDAEKEFELWISVPFGPSMTMLRNGEDAWLMYLREPGGSGLRSCGDPSRSGMREFKLTNGQDDEFPLAWCIDIEQCCKAVAYFYVNDGEKTEWIEWAAC